ncbi:hypothetical protein [Actinoplanes subtropicus]|uniref:hypothetical protein n=1 Tax=Actinoplanes subtropicus TaxID=543632 RepID=UPI0004C38D03|nr:hypothetical protein [Actinoplanes subtropicus]
MNIQAPTRTIDSLAAAEALVAAAEAAGYAPSIGNTQPWRWRLTGDTLDLHLVRSRMRRVSDLDGRLATVSCGAEPVAPGAPRLPTDQIIERY